MQRYLSFSVLWMGLVFTTSQADEGTDELAAATKIELLKGKITRAGELPTDPVTGIDLRGSTRFNDRYLHLFVAFPRLTSLNLAETSVTDDGLKEIKNLHQLTTLNLFGTAVTDAGLKNLRELSELQVLQLGRTKITDAGLKEIAGLEHLSTLIVLGTRVTDTGLQDIGRMKNLKLLHLGDTMVTDKGLLELKGLTRLRTLFVTETRITYPGKQLLLGSLPDLDIPGPQIPDRRSR